MELDSRFLILNQKSCIFGEKLIHNEESVFLFSELAFRQFWYRKLLLHAKQTKELGRGDAELYQSQLQTPSDSGERLVWKYIFFVNILCNLSELPTQQPTNTSCCCMSGLGEHTAATTLFKTTVLHCPKEFGAGTGTVVKLCVSSSQLLSLFCVQKKFSRPKLAKC